MFPAMDLAERNALRDNTQEHWERACAIGQRVIHASYCIELRGIL
jgi:hypothetical protein